LFVRAIGVKNTPNKNNIILHTGCRAYQFVTMLIAYFLSALESMVLCECFLWPYWATECWNL